MTDSDKVCIKPLDETSNYALWNFRVEAACQGKGITAAFSEKEFPAGDDRLAFEAQRLQVSGIIITALEDHVIRVVKSVKGMPVEMLEKLNSGYESKTVASKISNIMELVSLRYTIPAMTSINTWAA